MTRTAVYAGSFDPPTLAHIDIIQRVSKMFDKIFVVLAQNPRKQYLLSEAERVNLLKAAITKYVPNGSCEIQTHGGLITDFCRQNKASILVRGMRAVSDFEGELAMATMNRRLNADVDTVHVMTHPDYFFVSSSLVKEVAIHGGSLDGLVPEGVAEALKRKFA